MKEYQFFILIGTIIFLASFFITSFVGMLMAIVGGFLVGWGIAMRYSSDNK